MFRRKIQIHLSKNVLDLYKNVYQIHFCEYSNQKVNGRMRVLNVAEKNDAAKNIAGHLSGGNLQRVILPSILFKKDLYLIVSFLFNFREKVFQNLIKYTNLVIVFKGHPAQ
jgi:ABC-type Mn2+/Zn2+ transport system ATPase subunit